MCIRDSLKGQKGLLALKDKSSSSSPSSSESKSQPVAKKKRAVSASSGSSSDSQSSEKKPTDNEVALNNQLQTAKKDFDTIFSALHHCQQELKEAKLTIEKKEAVIARLEQEIERLQKEERNVVHQNNV